MSTQFLIETYPFALSIVERSNGVLTQSGGRNDIRYLRYGHEFRKFAQCSSPIRCAESNR